MRSNGQLVYRLTDSGDPDLSQPVYEEITRPNDEVRTGAILSLGRIGRDSEKDIITCIRILAAYVQRNSNTEKSGEPSPQQMLQGDFFGYSPQGDNSPITLTRNDIELAINTAIALRDTYTRRTGRNFQVDFSTTDLSSTLIREDLVNSDLRLCSFKSTTFVTVSLDDCNLGVTDFRSVTISNSDFVGCSFFGSKFDKHTRLATARLRGAAFANCDLSRTDITEQQLQETYGDRTVTLPEGMRRPRHWNKSSLDTDQWRRRWRAFQNHIGYAPRR